MSLTSLNGLPTLHDRVQGVERAINDADVADQVVDAVLEFGRPFGIATVAMAHLVNPAAIDLRSTKWFNVNNWPEEWADSWKDLRFMIHDPVARQAARTNRPFTWSAAYALAGPEGRSILDRSRDFGFKDGIAIPIHSLAAPTGCVTLGAERLDLSPLEHSALQLVSHAAYSKLENLLGPFGPSKGDELTDREGEVMHWIAAGKSDWEVGAILGVSQHTIREHVRHACEKLGVSKRTAACARAVSCGHILPA